MSSTLIGRIGERRTVQFMVERPCEESGNLRGAPADFFPTVLWVFWPAEPNNGYGCPAETVYRHAPETPFEHPKGFSANPGQCVCEHMGHVIE